MKPNLRYILSPCGTSLLTNVAPPEKKGAIFANANKQKDEIEPDDLAILTEIAGTAEEKLMSAGFQTAARLSAELNGIIQIYGSSFRGKNDHHLLLSTHTFLGETTSAIVAKWLLSQGDKPAVELHRQADLQTDNLETFHLALSDLIKKLSDDIPSFREKGYRIVFNLTGGFKVVQGFLQSVAHFFADESVYIFETSQSLLRIPRIPVKLDVMEPILANLRDFRRLGLELECRPSKDIHETFLYVIDGKAMLSPWGKLVWEQSKGEIYRQRPWDSPSDKIRFGDEFAKSVAGLEARRIKIVNERIDQLANHLERPGGANLRSLDFKPLSGDPLPPCTHECDAWADQDAKRMYGFFDGDVFVLHKLGKALH